MKAAQEYGLKTLGGFHVQAEHKAPEGIRSIALLGFSREGWSRFKDSPEATDGAPNPLDRWSLRVVTALAEDIGAMPFFPFGGPPYHPFLRWAEATGRIWQSPVGMSIHDKYGLWMAFRGALGFADARDDVRAATGARPCDSCTSKPCLGACPVDAFATGAYDVPTCVAHIGSDAGQDCLTLGCRVRHACPVGQDWAPSADKAAFHMLAFKRAREAAG